MNIQMTSIRLFDLEYDDESDENLTYLVNGNTCAKLTLFGSAVCSRPAIVQFVTVERAYVRTDIRTVCWDSNVQRRWNGVRNKLDMMSFVFCYFYSPQLYRPTALSKENLSNLLAL